MDNKELISIIYQMSKTSRCCQQDSIFCEGVTFTQFRILELVAQNSGNLRLSELHDLLSVEKSTTTRLINPLIKKGLLKQERDLSDARARALTLTETGEEVLNNFWQCLNNFLNIIQKEIGHENIDQVIKNVEIFLRAVRVAFTNETCCR